MEPEDATIISEFVETKKTEKLESVKETKEEVKDDFSELEYKKKIRLEHKVIGAEDELKALENAVLGDHATLLIGDTGVGKTYRIQALAKKHGKKMVRVSLNGEIGINELLGKWLVKDGSTYWQDGTLTQCMRNGDWIILDEINAALPEVLFCLNSLLDDARSIVLAEKDNELVTPHENFRIFATMNPSEDYAGTKELNPALLSRFTIVLWVDFYKPKIESKIVQYQSGVVKEIAEIIVDIGNIIRKSRKEAKTWFICSTRDLVNMARLFRTDGLTFQECFEWAILNKAPEQEKPILIKVLDDNLKSKIKFDWKTKSDEFTSLISVDQAKIEAMEKQIKELEEKKKILVSEISEFLTKVTKES